jgi:hypothetical protein
MISGHRAAKLGSGPHGDSPIIHGQERLARMGRQHPRGVHGQRTRAADHSQKCRTDFQFSSWFADRLPMCAMHMYSPAAEVCALATHVRREQFGGCSRIGFPPPRRPTPQAVGRTQGGAVRCVHGDRVEGGDVRHADDEQVDQVKALINRISPILHGHDRARVADLQLLRTPLFSRRLLIGRQLMPMTEHLVGEATPATLRRCCCGNHA